MQDLLDADLNGWLNKPIGQVFKVTTGGTPSRNNASFWNGDIPWVKTGEVSYYVIESTEERITVNRPGFELTPKSWTQSWRCHEDVRSQIQKEGSRGGSASQKFAPNPRGRAISKKHIGSSLEDFLKEEGTFDVVTTDAVKRVLAWQIAKEMKAKNISKVEMAKRMGTSRSQLDRILDPGDDKVLLETVQGAAAAIGRRVAITLEGIPKRRA